MKIKKEEFNKLNQMDRIELLQKLHNSSLDSIIGGLMVISINSSLLSLIFLKYRLLIGVFYATVAGIGGWLLMLYVMIKSSKMKNKIEEEYFQIESKKVKYE